MVDIFSVLLGGGVGVAVALGVSYFAFFSRPRTEKVKVTQRSAGGRLTTMSVPASSLERSRREMRTMMVERDLLSSALMKLYEAESDGRITREERESIARKYSEQIKDIQSKLKDVELVVEVAELEKLREELVGMFQQKIQNIEARLDQAKERLGATAPEAMKREPQARAERVMEMSRGTDLERAVEKRARPEMSESERKVKELRDEVMDALTKLEQIDIEKKPQESN